MASWWRAAFLRRTRKGDRADRVTSDRPGRKSKRKEIGSRPRHYVRPASHFTSTETDILRAPYVLKASETANERSKLRHRCDCDQEKSYAAEQVVEASERSRWYVSPGIFQISLPIHRAGPRTWLVHLTFRIVRRRTVHVYTPVCKKNYRCGKVGCVPRDRVRDFHFHFAVMRSRILS